MKRIFVAVAAFALSGAPAFAADVGSCAADETQIQAEVLPNGKVITVAGFSADKIQSAQGAAPMAYANLGEPPSIYPVCRTRGQDRCRIPGQGLASARAARAPAG